MGNLSDQTGASSGGQAVGISKVPTHWSSVSAQGPEPGGGQGDDVGRAPQALSRIAGLVLPREASV